MKETVGGIAGKVHRYLLGLLFIGCLGVEQIHAEDIDNAGRNFWAVFPSHIPVNPGQRANMSLFVTSRFKTKGVVKIGGVKFKDFSLNPGDIQEIDIPYHQANLGDKTTISASKGIEILVDDSDPEIVAYMHIYAGQRSEATLLLPVDSYGAEYYAIGWNPQLGPADFRFVYNIVAISETTDIIIHERVDNVIGEIRRITLNQGEVYQFVGEPGKDYTGTFIQADQTTSQCKNFAVFSGNNAIMMPDRSADPLIQQLYTTKYWGTDYVFVPFKGPDNGNYVRVIAKEDNTQIFIGNNPPVILNRGAYYTSELLTDAEIIKADKPISVAQYALSQEAAFSSKPLVSSQFCDPDMVMLNPIESKTTDITVFSSTKQNIQNRFINIVLQSHLVGTLKVNGLSVDSRNAVFHPIGNTGYSYMQLDVGVAPYNGKSSLRLEAQDGFNAMCYGFGSFESYAYSAGTKLSSEVNLDLTDAQTGVDLTSACKDKTLHYKVTLAFKSAELRCDFDSGSGVKTYTPSDADYGAPVIKNGKTFYVYVLPEDVTYLTTGIKRIKIHIKLPPSNDVCVPPDGYKYFEQDIGVFDEPQAKFQAKSNACMGEEVVFTDQSTEANEWEWDFGDLSPVSKEQNPSHTYAKDGRYTVTLIVKSRQGCVNSTLQGIQIRKLPVALFNTSTPVCQNMPIQFKNISKPGDGNIIGWKWSFGDGTTSADQDPEHTYANAGTYTVSLAINDVHGCVETAKQTIEVLGVPDVKFTYGPKACEGSLVAFEGKVVSKDPVIGWEWDFGDNTNIGTLKDQLHGYDSAGEYWVTLKVTAKSGCVGEYKEKIKIHALPSVSFKESGDACSGNSLLFTDTSTGADGVLTREWDFGDNSTYSGTLASASHTYVTGGDFMVKLTLTTIHGCKESAIQKVHIAQLPQASFTHSVNICENTPVAFKNISTSREGNIVRWLWDFGGAQSSDSDPTYIFPKAGTFSVSLTVETDNGCRSNVFSKRIKVMSAPQLGFTFSDPICKNGSEVKVKFTNHSKVSGRKASDPPIKYFWDFGESGSAHNTSQLDDPEHAYVAPGNYTVTLKAAFKGCTNEFKQNVVVNSVPIPDFDVLNPDALCAGQAVTFIEKSTSSFGEISRIEWYFDYDQRPGQKVEDFHPHARAEVSKQYLHTYPVFHDPVERDIKVKMVAYTADLCGEEITKVIKVRSLPDIRFHAIRGVCSDAPAIALADYVSAIVKVPPVGVKEVSITSIPGSGKFSGKGVSPQGKFYPNVAGEGSHMVTYTFIPANNCSVTKSQTIEVHPLPKVNAGADQIILLGDQVRLNATAKGSKLTYKWTPAAGLNDDDILNPIASPKRSTTYKLVVTSKNGCKSTDEVFIKVLPPMEIPSAFSPNGDGINDTWEIKYLDLYEGATVEVFNRSGDLVFHSEGRYVPWDGKYGEQDLPVGAYQYVINPKNKLKPIAGTVSIIR